MSAQCTQEMRIRKPLVPPISVDVKCVPIVGEAIEASVSTIPYVLDINVENLCNLFNHNPAFFPVVGNT